MSKGRTLHQTKQTVAFVFPLGTEQSGFLNPQSRRTQLDELRAQALIVFCIAKLVLALGRGNVAPVKGSLSKT